MYSHVIWDWNGTLLDDVSCNFAVLNTMLTNRGMSALDSVDAYRRVFGFPVQQYYQRVGFDFSKEPFESLAAEYDALYHDAAKVAPLFGDARRVLARIHDAGLHQIVLSAQQADRLMGQVWPFGICGLFDEVIGLPDILAVSKVEMGVRYMQRVKPQGALLIGDTLHDKEVADALGADCVLVASGHQDRQTLVESGATVVDSLGQVEAILD